MGPRELVTLMGAADYISYQIAQEKLRERHDTTPEEIAIWVFFGPELGGLAAYVGNTPRVCGKADTCESYDPVRCAMVCPPPRFSFSDLVGAAKSEEDGNPLAACYFSKAAVDGFDPARVGRFISGKALIDRWRKFNLPDADIKVKVIGCIQNDELIDIDPVDGLSQVSGMKSSIQFEQAMFQLDYIKAIEERDFLTTNTAVGNAKPKRRAPEAFANILEQLLVEIETRAKEKKMTTGRWCIPGKKKDLLDFAKRKKMVAHGLKLLTFKTYIKNKCKFKQHENPIYEELFPEVFKQN